MNELMHPTMRRIAIGVFWAVSIISLTMEPFSVHLAGAAPTLPFLWSAGGLSAGNDSAGQAARIATDAMGNVAIVSGPAFARSLAVTSYTANGALRWQQTVSPVLGTFTGNWVAATPNGDFAAVGTNSDSSGNPIGLTLVRYSTDGTLLWRIDLSSIRPSVARLIADSAGNTYLAFNSIGNGQDIQLLKHSATGGVLWSQMISTGLLSNDIATSLALSPDGADVVLTGDVAGGAEWITALYDAATGARKWLVDDAEGLAARDVVMDANRVYVTGSGNAGITGYLTVIAYDRSTGTRLWRTDASRGTGSAVGTRIALAPDGSLVVAGETSSGGYIDWLIVALDINGAVKWEARRDLALSGDEIPASIFALADGTIVVSGAGGPPVRDILGNAYLQGVTDGYSSTGVLQWEVFAKLPMAWATHLPNGYICATGGYDAFIACWQIPGTADYRPVLTATPGSGTAPLTVNFVRSVTSDPNGPLISSVRLDYGNGTGPLDFGDGTSLFTVNKSSANTYTTAGTYTATLTATYSNNVSASDTVTIVVTPVITPSLRSTAINLSATLQKSKVSATGSVTVQNSNGEVVPGAVVSATWTKPSGGTLTQTATTNLAGIAKFSTSGNRGTYKLTVSSISKTGYSFDSANSVLSMSITR